MNLRGILADNSQTGICLCPWLAFRISCSLLAGRPSINSSRSISRSSNTSLVGSVGRRADLHRVWTRGRSTLPWNKRCSDEQAQRIFLPSDSVVSVIRSSPEKSTSLPARCYIDFSLPRPGLFHTTVHTTGVQSIQYARLAGRRSLKRVLLVEVRYVPTCSVTSRIHLDRRIASGKFKSSALAGIFESLDRNLPAWTGICPLLSGHFHVHVDRNLPVFFFFSFGLPNVWFARSVFWICPLLFEFARFFWIFPHI